MPLLNLNDLRPGDLIRFITRDPGPPYQEMHPYDSNGFRHLHYESDLDQAPEMDPAWISWECSDPILIFLKRQPTNYVTFLARGQLMRGQFYTQNEDDTWSGDYIIAELISKTDAR